MQPFLLNIPHSPPSIEGPPDMQGLFTPGESVRATVLEMQDAGKLLILVKGLALTARSLAGPLQPGQVIQARVERAEGQILLKLELPPQSGEVRQPALSENGTGGRSSSQGRIGQALSEQAVVAGPSIPDLSGQAELPGGLYQKGQSAPSLPIQTGEHFLAVPAASLTRESEVLSIQVGEDASPAAERGESIEQTGKPGPQGQSQEEIPQEASPQLQQPSWPLQRTDRPVHLPRSVPNGGPETMDAGHPAQPAAVEPAHPSHVQSPLQSLQALQARDRDPVAFVATVYGVGSANLLFLPLATKMKLKLKRTSIRRAMIISGLVGLAQGENPRLLQEKLEGFLPQAAQTKAKKP